VVTMGNLNIHEAVLETFNMDDEQGPEVSDWLISHFRGKITTLDLANWNFGDIRNRFWKIGDKGIEKLVNITTLTLASNRNVTNESIKNLRFIEHLDLSENNNITYEGVENMKNLHSLNLSGNHVFNDNMLTKLNSLRRLGLDFDNCYISDDAISKMTNLNFLYTPRQEFHFTANSVTDRGIENLTNLTKLNLYCNKNISDKGIKKLTNLTSLVVPDEQQTKAYLL